MVNNCHHLAKFHITLTRVTSLLLWRRVRLCQVQCEHNYIRALRWFIACVFVVVFLSSSRKETLMTSLQQQDEDDGYHQPLVGKHSRHKTSCITTMFPSRTRVCIFSSCLMSAIPKARNIPFIISPNCCWLQVWLSRRIVHKRDYKRVSKSLTTE